MFINDVLLDNYNIYIYMTIEYVRKRKPRKLCWEAWRKEECARMERTSISRQG